MTVSRQPRWVVSWTASCGGATGTSSAPQSTIRQTLRLSAGGRAIRLRFANPHTYAPLKFGAVTVALAQQGSAGLASAPLRVTVDGRSEFAVHPGAALVSDPVPWTVDDLATLTISIYTPDPVELSTHDWANRTSWSTLGALGNRTHDVSAAAFRPFGFSWLWVDAVEVLEPDARGALAVLGDSIADGAGSDFDTCTSWPELLAERLVGLPAGDPRRRTVANASIGGNTVGGLGTNVVGVNALSRLDRDVLSLAGVSEVLVAAGSNDIYLGATADELARDLTRLAGRIRAAGTRALIATIIPRGAGYQWSTSLEQRRQESNAWIRTQRVFDGVVDLDPVLADPASPNCLHPSLDADGTHPNTDGAAALAASVDLDVFATAGG